MLCRGAYAASAFTATQYVRNYDGSLGNETSANSYGKGQFFRHSTNDPVQSTTITEYTLPEGAFPARSRREVGSGWGTDAVPGERIVGVIEVPGGLRTPYPYGLSYVGASSSLISSSIRQTIDLPFIDIQPVPTPEARTLTRDSIVICWPSIRTFDDRGNRINMVETYAVYRSEHPSGPFEWLSDVPHKDGGMTYADSRISKGATYYYKLKLRYSWPANRPPYYETSASSNASKGVSVR